jgi:hypothetical protein
MDSVVQRGWGEEPGGLLGVKSRWPESRWIPTHGCWAPALHMVSNFENSEEQRLTVCAGKPLSSTTFLILKIKFVHLKLHGYFPSHLRGFHCCE